MNPALGKLAARPPSDTAGARAKNRFDFQRDWILCEILDLYEAGRDFVIVCDYHDDVLVVDAAPTCDVVAFFQVKTVGARRFTLKQLLKREDLKNGPGSSILGKLYSHRFAFPDAVGTTTLVSNLPPTLTAAKPPTIESRATWTVLDLLQTEQASILTSLSAELAAQGTVQLDQSFAFRTTPLSVKGHQTHAIGHVTEFLERLDGQAEHPALALYRTVADEIDRRFSREGVFTDADTMVKEKGFSKTQFDGVLNRCLATSRSGVAKQIEHDVRVELTHSGYGLLRTRRVCESIRRLAILRVDSEQQRITKLSALARAFLDQPNARDFKTLSDAMAAGAADLAAAPEARGLDLDDLMAMIAWEYFDEREPASPATKPQDPTP